MPQRNSAANHVLRIVSRRAHVLSAVVSREGAGQPKLCTTRSCPSWAGRRILLANTFRCSAEGSAGAASTPTAEGDHTHRDPSENAAIRTRSHKWVHSSVGADTFKSPRSCARLSNLMVPISSARTIDPASPMRIHTTRERPTIILESHSRLRSAPTQQGSPEKPKRIRRTPKTYSAREKRRTIRTAENVLEFPVGLRGPHAAAQNVFG